ncbi:MAG: hypothetical protein N2D54_09550, partial [Chloroflexota bacterium]
ILRGRLDVAGLAVLSIASIVGGIAGEVSLKIPFILTAIAYVLTLLVVVTIKEPPFEPDPDTGSRVSYKRALQITWQATTERVNLRYILLYSSIVPIASYLIASLFFQPFALSLGVSISFIGVISFGLQMSRMLGAASTQKLTSKLGQRRWLWVVALVQFVGMISFGLLNSISGFIFAGLVAFVYAASVPLIEKLTLAESPGAVRATILSVSSMGHRFLLSIMIYSFGLFSDHTGLPNTFIGIGIFGGLSLGLILLFWGLASRKKEPIPVT